MSDYVIDNIGALVTNDPELGVGVLGLVTDAALAVQDGAVVWVGPMTAVPQGLSGERIDAGGRTVLPGFVDSHAHLVFAGDRAAEFSSRMSGEPYEAGGIRTTVRATRGASDAVLRANVRRLVDEARRSGTTTIECKSGYGLTVPDELRSLWVAREFTDEVTFLGAHVVPAGFESDEYTALVAGPMMKVCAPQAKWIDVFCDRGAFDADQTRAILTAGVAAGLLPRLHANQLEAGPGVQIAVEFDAASADHVTHLTDADVAALAGSRTVATLLPGAEFSTRSAWPDARRLLDAGATVALATDCNPGSSYTTSMPFCIALAVREMGMTPDEAVWSATAGGAQALRRKDIGHLGIGAKADVILLDAPSPVHLAYRPGVPLVTRVWRTDGGELMSLRFEELDWQSTPMGEISLRRRLDPVVGVDVYEVKLGDEYLMSSLFTVAEVALATLGLAAVDGDLLDVVVGGLGLGYTARAVLEDPRVRSLAVVEALGEVVGWHERGLLPYAELMTGDARCSFVRGDFFALAAAEGPFGPGVPPLLHAILVDIDHTPTHVLHPSHAAFYSVEGLRRLRDRLHPGGVFALWSDDPPDERFLGLLREVFAAADGQVVSFDNPVTGGVSANSVYVARSARAE